MTQHTVLAFWIVGPSAIGSVKGIPSSITSIQVNTTLHGQYRHVARTSTTRLHPQHDIGRFLRCGKPRGHVGDESRLRSGLEPNCPECVPAVRTLPSFLHCAKVFLMASMVGYCSAIEMDEQKERAYALQDLYVRAHEVGSESRLGLQNKARSAKLSGESIKFPRIIYSD